MAKGDNLGEFELLILAALAIIGKDAYGVTVHEQVENLASGTPRVASLGACYTTLDRLAQKGYARSRFSAPTPQRGGRAKRIFEITRNGKRALGNSLRIAENVATALRKANPR